MNSWKSVDKGEYPENLETVWLTNGKGWVALGCLVETEDGWYWAESNGVIYSEGIKIVAECESDDLDVKFWHSVPTLPEYIKEKTVPIKKEDVVVKFVNDKQPDHIEGYHTFDFE